MCWMLFQRSVIAHLIASHLACQLEIGISPHLSSGDYGGNPLDIFDAPL